MKKETLEKAKELEKDLAELVKHLDLITTSNGRSISWDNAAVTEIYVAPTASSNNRRLRTEFLPISISEYVEMYIARVIKRIKQLEAEIENL